MTLKEVVDGYLSDEDLDHWLSVKENILLENQNNYAMFSYEYPGLYTGHYFFSVRGKEAKNQAHEFLNILFTQYPAKAIQGLTPVENLGARWISRQLGFSSYGIIQTQAGPCEHFILTKEQYKEKQTHG